MKNSEKKYAVRLVEDYDHNGGNPDSSSTEYATLSAATAAYEAEIKEEYKEHGKTCEVQLWNYKKDHDEPIRSDYKKSALLPKDGVIVTYQHLTHINYCYAIVEIRKVNDGERYEDLNVSVDYTNRNWDVVYDSIGGMQLAYENAYSTPMDKIQTGAYKIEEFLDEN